MQQNDSLADGYLRARVDEEADLQRVRQRRRQLLGQQADVLVQVPGVGVQHRDLRRHRGRHPLVRVPDVPDVVPRVEVLVAGLVVQVLPLAADDQKRVGVLVRDALGFGEVLFPQLVDPALGHRRGGRLRLRRCAARGHLAAEVPQPTCRARVRAALVEHPPRQRRCVARALLALFCTPFE